METFWNLGTFNPVKKGLAKSRIFYFNFKHYYFKIFSNSRTSEHLPEENQPSAKSCSTGDPWPDHLDQNGDTSSDARTC